MARLALQLAMCATLVFLLSACQSGVPLAPSSPLPPLPTDTPRPAPPSSTPSAPVPAAPTKKAPTASPPTATTSAVPRMATTSAAPTSGTTEAQKALREANGCLVGTWEVGDMSGYIASIMPIELLLDGELQFQGTTGSMHYTFGSDGQAELNAHAFSFDYLAKVADVTTLPLQVIIDGTSSGSYSANLDFLTLSPEATAGLEVIVVVAGERMMAESRVANLVPLAGTVEQEYLYWCEGSSLKLLPPPEVAQSITLKRVGS